MKKVNVRKIEETRNIQKKKTSKETRIILHKKNIEETMCVCKCCGYV